MPRLCNPVLLTRDLTHSFCAHTFSLLEDPWPTFSFRAAYAHRIFDDATQCKSCFRIASASACLELSSVTASATFRYAGFSVRKRNSRTSPLCNFIMEVFDAAQFLYGPSRSLLSLHFSIEIAALCLLSFGAVISLLLESLLSLPLSTDIY